MDGREVAWESWTRGTTFFEEGCDEVTADLLLEAGRPYKVEVDFASRDAANLGFSALAVGLGLPTGEAEIAEAVEAACSAKVAVLCVGRDASWDTEGADLPGIRLPGRQDAPSPRPAKFATEPELGPTVAGRGGSDRVLYKALLRKAV